MKLKQLFKSSFKAPILEKKIDLAHTSAVVKIFYRKNNRRMILKAKDDGFSLTVPLKTKTHIIDDFLKKSHFWMEKNQVQEKTIPQTLSILGHDKKIDFSESFLPKIHETDDTLFVHCHPLSASHIFKRFLKQKLSGYLKETAPLLAAKIDKKITSIQVRDMNTRWGSCSKNGGMRFSLYLCLAPKSVIDYVIAHEVSHLLHMNHSECFWNTVATIDPSYEESRQWLKKHGHKLFQML